MSDLFDRPPGYENVAALREGDPGVVALLAVLQPLIKEYIGLKWQRVEFSVFARAAEPGTVQYDDWHLGVARVVADQPDEAAP